MTLNYRMPDTREHRVLQVSEQLAIEEAFDWLSIGLRLLVGVPMCAVVPMFVTYLMRRLRVVPQSDMLWWLAVLSGTFIPVMFVLQRMNRDREYLWDAMGQAPDRPAGALPEHSALKYFPAQVGWSLIVEICLLGPRLIWSIIDQVRTDEDHGDLELRVLCARIVVELLDAGQSVPMGRLMTGDRTTAELTRGVKYLLRRGWVCVPRRRDHVWLAPSIRKQLADLQ